MARKKELIQFTLQNTSDCAYNIPMMQNNNVVINSTTEYQYDITSADLSCGYGSIVINGVTYNITYQSGSLTSLIAALNNLGFGFFCSRDCSITTTSTTTSTTTAAPSPTSTTSTTTSTTTAAGTTTSTTTSTTTAAGTTTSTTTSTTTDAATTTSTTTSTTTDAATTTSTTTSTTTAAPTTTSTTTSTTTAAPTTTSTTTSTTTNPPAALNFTLDNTSITNAITINLSFDSVLIASGETSAANTNNAFFDNPISFTPNVATLVTISYSGYTPTSATIFWGLSSYPADSIAAGVITFNSVNTTEAVPVVVTIQINE